MQLNLRHVTVPLLSIIFLATGCNGFFTNGVLQSITVAPPSAIIGQGGTVQMSATGVNDDGSTSSLKNVTWSSSNTGVATVNDSGVVTAVTTGSTTITATSGTITGTTTVNVTSANLVSIIVTPATAVVAPGQQQQFTAMGQLANGQSTDITSIVTWTSSDTSVATITNAGVATAQSSTSSTTSAITATSGQITGTATLSIGV